MHPPLETHFTASSDNNSSLVLLIIYGNRKFLFTGDIERQTEKELAKNPELLRSDVVKVAHHGSKTSSTTDFVNATKAEFAVISVGRKSPYNHPHEQVVERWQQGAAKILTTGKNGTISFSTDGSDLQVTTFISNSDYSQE